MKKKIFSGVFALALLATAGLGAHKSMNSNAGLSDLALSNVLALANVENPGSGEGSGMANKCCRIWNVTLEIGGTIWPKVTCTTGGEYKCVDCSCR